MKIKSGDCVNVSLTLLSVDGEGIPPGSGEQTIQRSVVIGQLYSDALDNFLATEVSTFGEDGLKNYHIPGDLFFPKYRKDLICEIPRENMDKDIKEGEIIQNKKGNVGYVVDTKNKESVAVDFNHPFSNKTLEVKLKVLQNINMSGSNTRTSCSSLH